MAVPAGPTRATGQRKPHPHSRGKYMSVVQSNPLGYAHASWNFIRTLVGSGGRVGSKERPGSFGIVFVVVGAGIAMVNMDLFIANVALPTIGRAFGGADLASLSWVLNAYAIIF